MSLAPVTREELDSELGLFFRRSQKQTEAFDCAKSRIPPLTACLGRKRAVLFRHIIYIPARFFG